MAVTDGFWTAGQLSEGVMESVFAQTFLERFTTFRAALPGGEELTIWFDRPLLQLLPSPDPAVSVAEVELRMTARRSDRWVETRASLKARGRLTHEKVNVGVEPFTGPALDFRQSGPSDFRFSCVNPEFEQVLRAESIEFLQVHSPFTVGPLMRDGNVLFRTYGEASGTCTQDLTAFFLEGLPPGVATPPRVTSHLSSATKVVVLVHDGIVRQAFDVALSSALQSVGIASLPGRLPQFPAVLLRVLAIDLARGHLILRGEADLTLPVLESNFTFSAYIQLLLNNGRVQPHIIRVIHDLDSPLFDVADFLTAGLFTRLLETLVPEAVGKALGGLALDLDDLSFFSRNASAVGPYADARSEGIIDVDPGGLIIPAEVTVPSGNPVRPPYLRGHSTSREFHVRGCGWGDLITAALVEFPSWQAAIEAGYDGCFHCQKQFSVPAFGDLRMKVVHPPGAEPGPVTFTGTFAGQAVRFDIILNPPPEQETGTTFEDGGVTYHLADFSHIVPGKWDIVIQRGSWSVSGRVKVERRWRDSEGHTHGNQTEVTATLGQPGLHITAPT